MSGPAADLARRLAREAEAVCRFYLSRGRRQGGYWIVGDTANNPGRSLYVRLHGGDSGPGAAGKWTDAQSGEHGDLLDLIGHARGLTRLADVLEEARAFLALPPSMPAAGMPAVERKSADRRSEAKARRLFRAGHPVTGTQAEAYLRARGITLPLDWPSLRFYPTVWYRACDDSPRETCGRQSWPALLAAVTAIDGHITGLQRTWLDPARPVKAQLTDPRRAMGHLLGNGVRFGAVRDQLAAGEGVETMLALKSAFPWLPVIAALSASHLAALELPPGLRRLYVARDNDDAGYRAFLRLRDRAMAKGIDCIELVPILSDFNADLSVMGCDAMRARLSSAISIPAKGTPAVGGLAAGLPASAGAGQGERAD